MRKFVAILVLFLVAPGTSAHKAWPMKDELKRYLFVPANSNAGIQPVIIHFPDERCIVTAQAAEHPPGQHPPLLAIFPYEGRDEGLDVYFRMTILRSPENGYELTSVDVRWQATGLTTSGLPNPTCDGSDSYSYSISVETGPCPMSKICPGSTVEQVLEFYNPVLDHYFITWAGEEVLKLADGTSIKGWSTTGYSFLTYPTEQDGTTPVCRFYIPPAMGDSHFFGRGTAECDATAQKNPSFVLEDPAFMHMLFPNLGVCPANSTPIYRVFNNRPDANHRYLTDKAERDKMVAKGWIAEGDGPDRVVMCAPLYSF